MILINQFSDVIVKAIIGRKTRQDQPPVRLFGKTQYSAMGFNLGIPDNDIHCNRQYHIYITLESSSNRITDATVTVDGELISPCSGYMREEVDEFDLPYLLDWVNQITEL